MVALFGNECGKISGLTWQFKGMRVAIAIRSIRQRLEDKYDYDWKMVKVMIGRWMLLRLGNGCG